MKKNKFLSLILSISVIFSTICSCGVSAYAANSQTNYNSDTTVSSGIIGDVNLDGSINLKDIILLQKSFANLVEQSDFQKLLGDTNGDGNENLKDIICLQKYIANISVTSKIGQVIENPMQPTESPTSATEPATAAPTVQPTEPTTQAPTAQPTEPATEDPHNYIYVSNNENWIACYAYMWKTGSSGTVQWPGTAMTNIGNNIYRIELPDNVDSIIFSSPGNSTKTDDLKIPATKNALYFLRQQTWGTYEVKEAVTLQKEHANDLALQSEVFALLDQTQFSKATWDSSDTDGKKAFLNKLVVEINKIQNTSVRSTISFFEDSSTTIGTYMDVTGILSLNFSFFKGSDGYDRVNTVFHEMRHAYQHSAITNPTAFTVSSETLTQWSTNFTNYINYGTGVSYTDYVSQPVEYDSRSFAKQYSSLTGATPTYTGGWLL